MHSDCSRTKRVLFDMVSSKELTSKSILNLLFDYNKLEGRAQYESRREIGEEEQYWSCTCSVQLVGKNADKSEKPIRIDGHGTNTKKGVATTLAADSVVAQLKKCGVALEDEVICKTLKVPFADKGDIYTNAETTSVLPPEFAKENILGVNIKEQKGIAIHSKNILDLLFDNKKLDGRAQYSWRTRIRVEEDPWTCACAVLLVRNNADKSEKPVLIIGGGKNGKKSVAMSLAADAVVAKLKTCRAALEDEIICKTLKVPFVDVIGDIGSEKAIGAPAEVGKAKSLGGNVNREKSIAITGDKEGKEKIGGSEKKAILTTDETEEG